jgi:hypothetical protein
VARRDGAIIAKAPETSGFIFLGAPRIDATSQLGETAPASMQDAGFAALHGQAAEINGLKAWVGFYNGRLREGGVVIVEAAHVVLDGHVYLIAGVAPFAAFESVRDEFFATINSFGAQADAEGISLVAAPSAGAGDVFDAFVQVA